MKFQIRNFMPLALIFVIAYITPIQSTVTITTSFESYNNTITKLTSMSDRLTMLHAVWGEIRADDAENMEKTKSFYDNLLLQTKSAVNAEAEEAAELAEEIRNVLIVGNGRLLAETLNNNNSQKITNVQVFRTLLLTKYDVELLSAIFENAIDAAFNFKATDLLHAELNTIDLTTTNANIYRLRINWNLYLFYKFLHRGEINDKYVYEAAFALRNLKFSTYYNSLPTDVKRRIDVSFKYFPSSLSVLFNSTSICLESVNLPNYFLYFAESNTSTASSYVPAVIRGRHEMKNYERLVWANNFAEQSTIVPTTLNLKLKFNSWYLYRQISNTNVIVQRSDSTPSLRNWKPSLRDNKIMFEQDGYHLCASTNYAADLIGFTVQSMTKINLDNTNCQWMLKDCSDCSSI